MVRLGRLAVVSVAGDKPQPYIFLLELGTRRSALHFSPPSATDSPFAHDVGGPRLPSRRIV